MSHDNTENNTQSGQSDSTNASSKPPAKNKLVEMLSDQLNQQDQPGQNVEPTHDPLFNENIIVKNQGQKLIYSLRKAHRQGKLFATDNLAPEVQVELNKPQEINQSQFKPSPQDQAFLQDIITKINSGQIALYTPSTLLNQQVYDQLDTSGKAKADFDILNLLNRIREIKKLWDSGNRDSFQIYNLVKSLRSIKERIEAADGDVFII